ncbi:thiol-disulfide oxidoreductase ResA [Neobacillus notoginsengisoli]|uniref:Thiol-disulfide oxidoreductase ResA n=1 Tax=Neobacillus notoginsengisoli TaxID=1578198 RepID=A0A417YQI6_9BACI|nr:thiol-disulfide oxidoreductase ResA [Neobacillus notoginsengisoli]RHW36053.1 thiol-disulfide oxidoreductase ResA [Neobacillus notoginsengisoli]
MKKTNVIIVIILLISVIFAIYKNTIDKNESQKASVNFQAPNFNLKTLDGNVLELKKLRGKAVLINFWATWCEPCKKEMPDIQEAYNQYKDQNFEIIGVGFQESEISINNFIQNYHLSFPVVIDKSGEVINAYSVRFVPTSVFIDSEGTIKRTYEGQMSRDQLDQWIKEILPKN